jgi:hypothetical protein
VIYVVDFAVGKEQNCCDKLVGTRHSKVATYRPSSDLVNEARNKFLKNVNMLCAQRVERRLFTILTLIVVNV